ncbi:MAG TPA: hypothetical protein PK636_07195 [bacterium]|nr:hypothetical protein [bacterium]HPJ72452.1 hypothetical protein [bacterium]HPQ67356.1 hypothetical protein [bacterium]
MSEENNSVEEIQEPTTATEGAPEGAGSGDGAGEEPREETFAKKKIRLMTADEIDQALARARKHMGSDKACYIKHLLERKAELSR